MQRVDSFHHLTKNAGWQRHTSALVHPSEQQRGSLPAPVYQRALHMCSLSQDCAFMISLSLSKKLKSVCNSLLSLHRNSTPQKRQRISKTRHNKRSFTTPTILAFPASRSLCAKTIPPSPNLPVLILFSLCAKPLSCLPWT